MYIYWNQYNLHLLVRVGTVPSNHLNMEQHLAPVQEPIEQNLTAEAAPQEDAPKAHWIENGFSKSFTVDFLEPVIVQLPLTS